METEPIPADTVTLSEAGDGRPPEASPPRRGSHVMRRRSFLVAAGALACAPFARIQLPTNGGGMYGLIGKITAVPGQRDALAAILLDGVRDMPGCLSYVVAGDSAEPEALWITEVWDSAESHLASLGLPAVQAAISRGRPLIAGFSDRIETEPIGGIGLPPDGS